MDNTGWARAYLGGIRNLYHWIRYMEKRIVSLEADIVSYGSTQTGDRVQSSPRGDQMERRVIKYVETIERLQVQLIEKKSQMLERQDEAFARIMELKEGHRRDFLVLYYIEGMSYAEISFEMGHSEQSRIYHLRDEAIEYFAKVARDRGWK